MRVEKHTDYKKEKALRFFTGKQKAMLRQVQREENREIREALKRIERLLEELTKSVQTENVKFRQKDGKTSEPPY